ncbi:TPA: hypothetical protein ACH3X1_009576 [Trebouxia sp. C0004]
MANRTLSSMLSYADRGYRLEVVTVRKLEFETDGLAFGDKILARWYPNKADADKKGIMIVVTTGKDGAITGGPSSRSERAWSALKGS